jgi:hypothetical protein
MVQQYTGSQSDAASALSNLEQITLAFHIFGAPPVWRDIPRHCVELGATYVRLSFTSRYYSQPVVVTASKFILGAGLGIPASALCISRRTPLPLCRVRQSPGEM